MAERTRELADVPAFQDKAEADLSNVQTANFTAKGLASGFLTSAALSGYSQVGHTHVIGDVTGLQSALNTLTANSVPAATQDGRLLTLDGGVAVWGPQSRLQAIAGSVSLALDTEYGVDTSAARTLTLPVLSSADVGQSVVVRDATGNAATFNIGVQPAGADTFLSPVTSPLEIDTNYAAAMFVATASGWRVYPL